MDFNYLELWNRDSAIVDGSGFFHPHGRRNDGHSKEAKDLTIENHEGEHMASWTLGRKIYFLLVLNH